LAALLKNNPGNHPGRYKKIVFSRPDYYRRPRNYTGSALIWARGLYHRWGLSPRPEDLLIQFFS